MTRKQALKHLTDYVDYMEAEVTASDEEIVEWREAIAALEAEPLAEGMGAEYGHTGVWMVWSGELGQLPWLQEPAVKARRVAIYGVDE